MQAKNAFIEVYSKCGSFSEAEWIFYEIEENNIMSWDKMIGGSIYNSRDKKLLHIF